VAIGVGILLIKLLKVGKIFGAIGGLFGKAGGAAAGGMFNPMKLFAIGGALVVFAAGIFILAKAMKVLDSVG